MLGQQRGQTQRQWQRLILPINKQVQRTNTVASQLLISIPVRASDTAGGGVTVYSIYRELIEQVTSSQICLRLLSHGALSYSYMRGNKLTTTTYNWSAARLYWPKRLLHISYCETALRPFLVEVIVSQSLVPASLISLSLEPAYISQNKIICLVFCLRYSQGQSGILWPGTLRIKRKWRSPIFLLRTQVARELSALAKPTCLSRCF